MEQKQIPWLRRISTQIDSGTMFTNLYIVDDSTPPPGGASQTAAPRLHVMLAGRRRMRAACGGRELAIDLCAGDLLFAHPGAWLIAEGASGFTAAGVVYGDRFLRCSHRPWGMHRAPLVPPPHWHHTGRPPSPVLNGLIMAMLALDRGKLRAADGIAIARALAVATFAEALREGNRFEPYADRAQRTWEALCAWLEEQQHRDIGRGDAARAFGISPNHITRLFARFGRQGFHDHLADLRLARARNLLVGTGRPLAEIAASCGITPHRLIRCFKRRFGTTPGAFRNAVG